VVITVTKADPAERMTVEAIPTEWNGYRTRSRLEMRWIVVLDYLGISFQYEPEGYRFPDGTCYLCDFRIDKQERWVGDGCWIETKGQEPTTEEEYKAWLLAKYTKKPVYILFGDCWLPVDKSNKDHDGGYLYYPNGDWENFQWLYQCPKCEKNGIGLFGQSVESLCGCPVPTIKQNDLNPKLMAAFRKARGTRFDRKEKVV
jgi:hypothetical protein